MAHYHAFINRELRAVPLTWEHPRDERGAFDPLFKRSGLTEADIAEDLAEGKSRAAIEGAYMPDFSHVPPEQMGIQAYETTSEGTPISPVFPDSPEGRYQLVAYCADHETVFAGATASEREWAHVLFGGELAAVDLHTGTITMAHE
jgi:hypothetical protein